VKNAITVTISCAKRVIGRRKSQLNEKRQYTQAVNKWFLEKDTTSAYLFSFPHTIS